MIRNNLDRAGILSPTESDALFKGAGCDACQKTGYLGRVGVYEVLRLNDALREAIGQGDSEARLRQLALEQRTMTGFKQYAGFLLRSGFTTPAEALRLFGGD